MDVQPVSSLFPSVSGLKNGSNREAVANEFITLFLSTLLKEVVKPGTSSFSTNSVYSSLYSQELARMLAEQDAFGLKEVIQESIQKREK